MREEELRSRHSYLQHIKNSLEEDLLVCVFDSLREKATNNIGLLRKSKKIGEFQSLPEYGLFEVENESDPVLLKNCVSSVIFDVYQISEKTLEDLNKHYGYISIHNDHNISNREKIKTPYGDAYVFFNNKKLKSARLIDSGNWVDYVLYKEVNKENFKTIEN